MAKRILNASETRKSRYIKAVIYSRIIFFEGP